MCGHTSRLCRRKSTHGTGPGPAPVSWVGKYGNDVKVMAGTEEDGRGTAEPRSRLAGRGSIAARPARDIAGRPRASYVGWRDGGPSREAIDAGALERDDERASRACRVGVGAWHWAAACRCGRALGLLRHRSILRDGADRMGKLFLIGRRAD